MTFALTIYLTLNLAVITVLYFSNRNYLQIYLLEPRANALREARGPLIRDVIFALTNVNHLSIKEQNFLIDPLAVDLN